MNLVLALMVILGLFYTLLAANVPYNEAVEGMEINREKRQMPSFPGGHPPPPGQGPGGFLGFFGFPPNGPPNSTGQSGSFNDNKEFHHGNMTANATFTGNGFVNPFG